MLGFGLLGDVFIKIGVEPAPMVLGFVLGPMLEENFRRAMLLSTGDPGIFLERPISAGLLAAATLLLAALSIPAFRKSRDALGD
jgi:putative tricarboxylic transport membrane protein